MAKRREVDVSVELCHLYDREFNEESVGRGLRIAQPFLESLDRQGREYSTCILIDDYFSDDRRDGAPRLSIAEHVAIITEQSAAVGVGVDFIVSESGLAQAADVLLDNLMPDPVAGAGSVIHGSKTGRFLSNVRGSLETRPSDDAARGTKFEFFNPDAASTQALAATVRRGLGTKVVRGNHEIELSVEMWDTDPSLPGCKFSCAALAALWQLARLGWCTDEAGNSETPPGTIVEGDKSFWGRSTLSILHPDYIEIEHSVQVILSDLATRSHSTLFGPDGATPNAADVLCRINYVLINDDF